VTFFAARSIAQMRDCLLPLDAKSEFKHHMVHTLRVFLDNAPLLKSVLQIFLDEPLLDWAKLAAVISSAVHLRCLLSFAYNLQRRCSAGGV